MDSAKAKLYSTAKIVQQKVGESKTANAIKTQSANLVNTTRDTVVNTGTNVLQHADDVTAESVNAVGVAMSDYVGNTANSVENKAIGKIDSVNNNLQQQGLNAVANIDNATQQQINKIGGKRRKAVKKGRGDQSAATQNWEEDPAPKILPVKMGGKAKRKAHRSRSRRRAKSKSKK